jgi:ATP/maltotriose-dependent transcriptional regulator MalT
LALARLRARGQLTELRASELRFTPGEAAVLLQQVAGAPSGARLDAPLPDAVAATLAARTEGWAAGLQLAALSLRGQDDVDGFVAAFTGSHRHVLDYLAEEVLEQQPDRVREFLLETSVLERLSGQLCDTVTGRPGSQALLEQTERAGLFVVPLDEVRGWWRYHHLFADLLRARLQAEQPARVPELHRNAAAWYAERGLADDAIRHAVAAGEMTWAARLIEQHFDAAHSLRGEAGDLGGAARWTREAGLLADDEPDYARESGHLVLARVLLARARPGPALALLDRLYAAAAAQDRVASLIEIGALRALGLAVSGEEAAAVAALAGALTLACSQGYVRVFADEGAPMAALLARLIAAQRSGGEAAEVPLGCLARLERALGAQDAVPDAGRGGSTAVPAMIEQLTSRELEVLEMLAAGRSNQAIASQLVVTLDTVKKHVSHLLGKLGAANRTEAVARARQLGLIT